MKLQANVPLLDGFLREVDDRLTPISHNVDEVVTKIPRGIRLELIVCRIATDTSLKHGPVEQNLEDILISDR